MNSKSDRLYTFFAAVLRMTQPSATEELILSRGDDWPTLADKPTPLSGWH